MRLVSAELAMVLVLLLLLVGVLFAAWKVGLLQTRACLAVGGIAIAAVSAAALVGCAASPPKLPQQVIVTVERYKPLPAWATDPLPKPVPFNATVGAHLDSNEARGGVIDRANCDRKLLKLLDAGTPVDPKACGHE